MSSVASDSCYTSGGTIDDFKPRDSRRYGTLLPAQIAAGLSIVYLDDDDADDNITYTDFESTWEFSPPSFSQRSQSEQPVERSNGQTEAQKIAEDYRQRGSADADLSDLLNTTKDLPPVPVDRDSAYSLAISDDGQSIIDIEKRVEPTIRLFYHDQRGLEHAQHQGMEMIQTGLFTPGEMIHCQRPGCTDVLRDLEALKFHLHIHNIGDMSDGTSTLSAYPRRTPKNLRLIRMEFRPARKFHIRSKSSVDTDAASRYLQNTRQKRLSSSRRRSTTGFSLRALRDKPP